MPSPREVLIEHAARWRPKRVRPGDIVCISVPAGDGADRCIVETPAGESVTVEGRERDLGCGFTDVVATCQVGGPGGYRFIWPRRGRPPLRGRFHVR